MHLVVPTPTFYIHNSHVSYSNEHRFSHQRQHNRLPTENYAKNVIEEKSGNKNSPYFKP